MTKSLGVSATAALVLAVQMMALIWTNPWTATAAVVIFIWALWRLYRAQPLFLYVSLPLVLSWIWCAISVRYIEGGAYITEQFQTGILTGATSRFAVLALAFLTAATVVVGRYADRLRSGARTEPPAKGNFIRWALRIALVPVAALVITGLVYGFPLLSGVSRFAYWPRTPGLERFEYLIPCTAIGLGAAYRLSRRRSLVLVLAAQIAVQVAFSDKFSGPMQAITYFAMGYLICQAVTPGEHRVTVQWRKVLLIAPVVAVLLAGTTLYGYMEINGKSRHDAVQAIEYRALGLQGHVFYGVDQRVKNGTDTVRPTDFVRVNHEPSAPAGLVQLMYEVSPPAFVSAMRNLGIRFTYGYPAIALAAFGLPGAFLIQIFAGLLFGAFGYYLCLRIARQEIGGVLLAAIFLSNIITNALIMGDVYYLYRPLALILLGAMIVQHAGSQVGHRPRVLVKESVARTWRGLSFTRA